MILILNKIEVLEHLLKELSEIGVSGSTIIPSTGMAKALVDCDEYSFLNSLKVILDPEREESRTVLTLLKDELEESALDCIERVVGDLSNPNTAIVCTLPICNIRGINKNKK